MTLETRFPAVAEAAGYFRQAVTLLNREGGIVLLAISLLITLFVLRVLVGLAIPNIGAIQGAALYFLTALATALFLAAIVLKVRRAVSGRGIRWVAALEAAAPATFRLPRGDLLVVGLLGALIVGQPLVSLIVPLPGQAGPADTRPLLLAIVLLAVAAFSALLLLVRGRGRRLLALIPLLFLLFVTFVTIVRVVITPALAGPLLVDPTLRAVEGVQVNVTLGNQTFQVPVNDYCTLTAGPDTPGLIGCLQANLPAERFAALSASVNWAFLLISFLADPSRGLVVLVPFLLLMPRLALAIPAAAVEGGLGLRRSWRLTRGRSRVPFWMVVMVLAMNGLLVSGLGFLMMAAGGAVALLYAVRQLGYGRGLDEVVRSMWFQGALALAGLGLVLMASRDIGPLLARVFTLAVGGTAVTLYYLKQAGANAYIPRAE